MLMFLYAYLVYIPLHAVPIIADCMHHVGFWYFPLLCVKEALRGLLSEQLAICIPHSLLAFFYLSLMLP